MCSFDASSFFVCWNDSPNYSGLQIVFPKLFWLIFKGLKYFNLTNCIKENVNFTFEKIGGKILLFLFCSGATAMRRATIIAAKTNVFRRTWEEVTDAFNNFSVKKLLRFNAKKKIFLKMKWTRFYQLFQTKSFCVFVLQNKYSQ